VITLPVVFAGNVDHGKSTLIARILMEVGYFPDGKISELEAAAKRRGVPVEISFLLDAFQVERDQAITIDSTRIWFASQSRRYEIIDAPGHHEFIRHMISGASDAVAALLVVDAVEGIGEQTRRHALLLELVGITRIIFAINKMDLVDFDFTRFRELEHSVKALSDQLGLKVAAVIPTAARDGDNVVAKSTRMPWYEGATVLDALESIYNGKIVPAQVRFPVQDVFRRNEERILLGTVRGGRIESGMTLVFSPSRETARVKQIVRFPASDAAANTGEAVGIILDRPIFVQPGDVASGVTNTPSVTTEFDATIFWLDARPLRVGDHLDLRCGTQDSNITVALIRSRIEVASFEHRDCNSLELNDVGDISIFSVHPIVLDRGSDTLGRFALYRDGIACGGGLVRNVQTRPLLLRPQSTNVSPSPRKVSSVDRATRNGHRGLVVWLTGLPSSGKTTLAILLETALFDYGWQAYVLDGDTLRTGLNGDLDFSLHDREENVRRTGEAAALFADAGFIVIVSLVSPQARGRARAREAAPNQFHEVFVNADLSTCEARDVKGFYRRARAGEILDFTGVSSPYEEPLAPELLLDTTNESIAESFMVLLTYVRMAGNL